VSRSAPNLGLSFLLFMIWTHEHIRMERQLRWRVSSTSLRPCPVRRIRGCSSRPRSARPGATAKQRGIHAWLTDMIFEQLEQMMAEHILRDSLEVPTWGGGFRLLRPF
jgi:hypothetical protein